MCRLGNTVLNSYKLLLFFALALVINACVTPNETSITELPTVPADQSATITARSIINTSDIQHHHTLYVDGLVADRFEPDDVKSFQIAEGDHSLRLTCHSRNVRSGNYLPFNYKLIDGEGELDISVKSGEEICVKIGFKPLQGCAVMEQTKLSYCQITR